MEGDLNFSANGRRAQLFVNERRLQICNTENKIVKNQQHKISLSQSQLELSLAQLSPSLFLLKLFTGFLHVTFLEEWVLTK
jgi:hypothetical protein